MKLVCNIFKPHDNNNILSQYNSKLIEENKLK